jgi:hypothetical protein
MVKSIEHQAEMEISSSLLAHLCREFVLISFSLKDPGKVSPRRH